MAARTPASVPPARAPGSAGSESGPAPPRKRSTTISYTRPSASERPGAASTKVEAVTGRAGVPSRPPAPNLSLHLPTRGGAAALWRGGARPGIDPASGAGVEADLELDAVGAAARRRHRERRLRAVVDRDLRELGSERVGAGRARVAAEGGARIQLVE